MIIAAFWNTNARRVFERLATGLPRAKLLLRAVSAIGGTPSCHGTGDPVDGFIARMPAAGRTPGWRAARFITAAGADVTQARGTRRIFNVFLPRVRPDLARST